MSDTKLYYRRSRLVAGIIFTLSIALLAIMFGIDPPQARPGPFPGYVQPEAELGSVLLARTAWFAFASLWLFLCFTHIRSFLGDQVAAEIRDDGVLLDDADTPHFYGWDTLDSISIIPCDSNSRGGPMIQAKRTDFARDGGFMAGQEELRGVKLGMLEGSRRVAEEWVERAEALRMEAAGS